jgi:hypothetical protein
MAEVGQTLSRQEEVQAAAWVQNKLKESPELAPCVKNLIESGLIYNVLKASTPACLPDSCTSYGLVSLRVKQQCLKVMSQGLKVPLLAARPLACPTCAYRTLPPCDPGAFHPAAVRH